MHIQASGNALFSALRWSLTLALCLIFAAPLLAIVSGAAHPPGSVPAPGELWPASPSWASLRAVFTTVPLAQGLWNSLLISLGFVLVAVPLAAAAGFALSMLPRHLAWTAYALLILAASIPEATTWLPRFLAYQWLGLADSWWPLWMPALSGGSPLLVLLFAFAFSQLNPAPVFAARLEGLGWMRIFLRLVWPQVPAATAVAAILAAAMSWANFSQSLLYLQTQQAQTAPTLLHSLSLLGASYWPLLMAAALVVALPMVALVICLPAIIDRALEPRR